MRLDLGCGKNKKEGFFGVDIIHFEGVDVVCDLRRNWYVEKEADLINMQVPLFETGNGDSVGEAYLFRDNSVDELHCSHFVEHLKAQERITFMNECHRVLVPGGKLTLIAPHWASCRAYGDMTHQWPPVSEFWFYYLSKAWREANAPHDDIEHNPEGYSCDFEATWGYGINPSIQTRNQEFQQFALANYKEAITDLYATLVKK